MKLENLKGLRTTIIYGLIVVGMHIALFFGVLSQENYVELLRWSFGIYVGGKTLYKGTEVWQKKVDAQKS
jgi:hypothetical protein